MNSENNKIVELTSSRFPISPSELLLDLSLKCKEYNIEKFDVYGDNSLNDSTSWLRNFEKIVSTDLNMEDALFIPSGTMAQSMVLAQSKCKTFLCHYSSHLLLHENSGYKELLDLNVLIVPSNDDSVVQSPLSFDDIMKVTSSSGIQPEVIILEVPHREIGGKLTSWEDMVKISQFCKTNGIHLHMDGARLFEASAAFQDKTIGDFTSLFDTVYISFYKGIGALSGAMLLGKTNFITESRLWLRRFGGNLYSLLPYGVSCLSSYENNKNDFLARKARLVEVIAALTDKFISNKSNPLIRFDPPIPQVSMIHVYLNVNTEICIKARDATIQEVGISCFARIREATIGKTKDQSYFEFNMGPLNSSIALEKWIQGWESLINKLIELQKNQ